MPPLQASGFQQQPLTKAAVKHNPSQGEPRQQLEKSLRDPQGGAKPPGTCRHLSQARQSPRPAPLFPSAGPRTPTPPERPPRRPPHRAGSWERRAPGRAGPARPPPHRTSPPGHPSGCPPCYRLLPGSPREPPAGGGRRGAAGAAAPPSGVADPPPAAAAGGGAHGGTSVRAVTGVEQSQFGVCLSQNKSDMQALNPWAFGYDIYCLQQARLVHKRRLQFLNKLGIKTRIGSLWRWLLQTYLELHRTASFTFKA